MPDCFDWRGVWAAPGLKMSWILEKERCWEILDLYAMERKRSVKPEQAIWKAA